MKSLSETIKALEAFSRAIGYSARGLDSCYTLDKSTARTQIKERDGGSIVMTVHRTVLVLAFILYVATILFCLYMWLTS